jgi:thiamine-phosphate pyrophosphorylase
LRRGRLPALVLMTDDERLPDPLAAASALPRGSMVVVRARDAMRRDALARAMLKLARKRGLAVLIANDPALAVKLGADGLHLAEKRMGEAAYWHARFSTLMITSSAHSLRSLVRAGGFPLDAVFLSPIFSTESHPAAAAFSPAKGNIAARSFPLPVYALGGIDSKNARLIAEKSFTGISAIGALKVCDAPKSAICA